MPEDAILDFLRARSPGRIALVTHMRPDGDALGSSLGLARVLTDAGFAARVVNAGVVPSNLTFLCDTDLLLADASPEWWRAFDCLGVLDCGESDRLEAINRGALALPAFNIDHHATSAGVGDAVWNAPDLSSVGEMAVRLARRAGWRISPDAAQALWTAIVTDTGRFCFENATAAALDAARACVEAGARPHAAAEKLYQSVTPADRKLEAVVLARMELYEGGKLAAAWLTGQDFAEAGIGVEGAQDKINILRDTAGVEAAVFLYQVKDGDGVKASLRTASPHNALDVTGLFGGGGHRRAAGCTLAMPMEQAREMVIGAARRAFFPSGGSAR